MTFFIKLFIIVMSLLFTAWKWCISSDSLPIAAPIIDQLSSSLCVWVDIVEVSLMISSELSMEIRNGRCIISSAIVVLIVALNASTFEIYVHQKSYQAKMSGILVESLGTGASCRTSRFSVCWEWSTWPEHGFRENTRLSKTLVCTSRSFKIVAHPVFIINPWT